MCLYQIIECTLFKYRLFPEPVSYNFIKRQTLILVQYGWFGTGHFVQDQSLKWIDDDVKDRIESGVMIKIGLDWVGLRIGLE